MSTDDSPQTARARELYGDGPRIDEHHRPVPTLIQPGHFSDGQDRMGTRPETIHHGGRPDYDSPEGHRHREDLRGRPSPHRTEPSQRRAPGPAPRAPKQR